MTNFSFLTAEFPAIFSDAGEAENNTIIAPKYCALLCRSALEKAVDWLYENDSALTLPYDTKLSSLIHEQCFRNILTQQMFQEVNVIQLNGNNAAHGKKVNQYESLISLKGLFRFLYFLSKASG